MTSCESQRYAKSDNLGGSKESRCMDSNARGRLEIARRRVQIVSLPASSTDGSFASASKMQMKG